MPGVGLAPALGVGVDMKSNDYLHSHEFDISSSNIHSLKRIDHLNSTSNNNSINNSISSNFKKLYTAILNNYNQKQ